MTYMTIRNFIVLILVLIPLAGLAGCTPNYKTSDLHGTWIGQDETINSRGISMTKKTVILNVEDNGLIKGTTSWDLIAGDGGNHIDKKTNKDSEPVIGVFEPSTGRFYLAEMDEPGFWQGEMISKTKARCFLVQTGPKPVVSTIILERQSD